MNTNGKVIVGVIAAIVVIGGGYWWYTSMQSSENAPNGMASTTADAGMGNMPGMGTSSTTTTTTTTTTSSAGTLPASGDSDASLQQDNAAIDSQMSGLGTDNANITSAQNDQPTQ